MSAKKFRKKPVIIEAVQFDGTSTGIAAIRAWMASGEYLTPKISSRDVRQLEIGTLEGTMRANPHDWIIKGVAGEFYPCKHSIFMATYEEVEDD